MAYLVKLLVGKGLWQTLEKAEKQEQAFSALTRWRKVYPGMPVEHDTEQNWKLLAIQYGDQEVEAGTSPQMSDETAQAILKMVIKEVGLTSLLWNLRAVVSFMEDKPSPELSEVFSTINTALNLSSARDTKLRGR